LYFITDFANVQKEESKPPELKKPPRNSAKLWEIIIHRCAKQSCLNLVCGVLWRVFALRKWFREHGATYVWKLHFSSSCKYTHGVAPQLTWMHDTLPCVLICHVSFFLYTITVSHTCQFVTYGYITLIQVANILYAKTAQLKKSWGQKCTSTVPDYGVWSWPKDMISKPGQESLYSNFNISFFISLSILCACNRKATTGDNITLHYCQKIIQLRILLICNWQSFL